MLDCKAGFEFGIRIAWSSHVRAPQGESTMPNGPNEGLDGMKPLTEITVYTLATGNR